MYVNINTKELNSKKVTCGRRKKVSRARGGRFGSCTECNRVNCKKI